MKKYITRADGTLVLIDPSQDRPRYNKPSARIKKIWLTHNAMVQKEMGMYISLQFTIINFHNRTGTVCCFFYDDFGNKLNDYNNYYGYDGHVVVCKDFTPNTSASAYGDFKMFMPYNELHMAKGDYYLKFFLDIWDDNGNQLCRSDWVHFILLNS